MVSTTLLLLLCSTIMVTSSSKLPSLSIPQEALVVDTENFNFVKAADYEIALPDINEKELHLSGELMEGQYLREVKPKSAPEFPVEGMIMGPNRRFMINLLTRKWHSSSTHRNVIFIVDTGSPYTFLSSSAMTALGGGNMMMMKVEIQGSPPLPCYKSPQGKQFAEANVLGLDFLHLVRAQVVTDWDKLTFLLHGMF